MGAESLLQVVELFPGPALVVGPGGEILAANDPAGRWIGPGRDRLVGESMARFVADPPERLAGFLDECRRSGRKVAGALTAIGAGGECRVEGVAVPHGPGACDPTPVVVHVLAGEDDDREEALAALRRDMRRKDDLLDRLAHDLRNPVAAISSALHLVRRASAPEDVAWAQDAMERQIKGLVRQLDSLLELSRITRGRIELDRRRVDITAAARAAAAAVRPALDERDLRLTLTTSPGDLAVAADPARLEQILVDLLGHVAASAEPGASLRLSASREGDEIVLRVRDRGKDPSPATPSRGAVSSVSDDPSRRGQGLGLWVVRGLVELHGGSAAFPGDDLGGGGEYTVRLPAAHGPTGPATAPAGDRILVVDDNVDAARGTARLLQMAGHDVRVAHDGREALEIARGHRPRFILLDIGLPGMDGYEVARQLRGDPRHRDVTIIAISGYSEDDYRPPREVGFDHHLVKPLDYEALRAILNQSSPGGA